MTYTHTKTGQNFTILVSRVKHITPKVIEFLWLRFCSELLKQSKDLNARISSLFEFNFAQWAENENISRLFDEQIFRSKIQKY